MNTRCNCDKVRFTDPALAKGDPLKNFTAIDGVTGLAAVQICLVELLRKEVFGEEGYEKEIAGFIGHSAGETAQGYFV